MNASHLSVPTKPTPMSEEDRAYGRTTTRIQVAAAVWALWDRLCKEGDVDQQWLADRMGKSKSRVSRLLKGPGNWTLDTVADLLGAMEGRLTLVEAYSYQEIAQGRAARAVAAERPRHKVFVRAEMFIVEDDESLNGIEAMVLANGTLLPRRTQSIIEGSIIR